MGEAFSGISRAKDGSTPDICRGGAFSGAIYPILTSQATSYRLQETRQLLDATAVCRGNLPLDRRTAPQPMGRSICGVRWAPVGEGEEGKYATGHTRVAAVRRKAQCAWSQRRRRKQAVRLTTRGILEYDQEDPTTSSRKRSPAPVTTSILWLFGAACLGQARRRAAAATGPIQVTRRLQSRRLVRAAVPVRQGRYRLEASLSQPPLLVCYSRTGPALAASVG